MKIWTLKWGIRHFVFSTFCSLYRFYRHKINTYLVNYIYNGNRTKSWVKGEKDSGRVQSVHCTDSSDKQYQRSLSCLIACCVGQKKLEVNAVGSVSPPGWGWYPPEMCLGQRYTHALPLCPSLSPFPCWVGISYDCPEVSTQGQREGEITCKHMNCTEPVRCRTVPSGCPLFFLLCPLFQ